MKNKLLIYWIIIALLVLTFSLSFIKGSSKDRRQLTKSALLNPKYKSTVQNFVLYDSSNAIDFSFNGKFWTINNPTNPENKLPADNQKVNNLIENLSKVISIYKISDKINDKNSFGLDNTSTFHLIYYTDSGTNHYTDLIFGNHDFTQKYRYFTNGSTAEKKSAVYEIDTNLDSFLSSSVSSWNEGLIVSKNIIQNEDIQKISIRDYVENKTRQIEPGSDEFNEYSSKLLELRQGGFCDDEVISDKNIMTLIKISFGNLDELTLKIYPSVHEGEYVLEENYLLKNSSAYKYITKISAWTYSKLQ